MSLGACLVIAVSLSGQVSEWEESYRHESLVVMTRARAGFAVEEMRAVAVVEKPARELWAVISDVEGHTGLIPNTTESIVLKSDARGALVRQRFEPPFIDARESVVRSRTVVDNGPEGRRYTLAWRAAAHTETLVRDDAVRVDVNEGFWRVEELADGRARVTFQMLFDPAGLLPPFLTNLSQGAGAEQVLAALVRAADRPRA